MTLNQRALAAVVWLDGQEVRPQFFTPGDKFVNEAGEGVAILAVDHQNDYWLPNLPKFRRLMEKKFGIRVELKPQDELVLLVADYLGNRIEGAGVTEQDAIFAFVENFRDAHQQGTT